MDKTLLGQVYKVSSNFYAVKLCDKIVKCNARGVLKIKSNGISVGDFVKVNKTTIESVEERKNNFIRPNVSNIDVIVAVFSSEPKPDFYLLDKLLVNAIKEDVQLILAINKSDIDNKLVEKIKKEYQALGVKVVSVSAKSGEGVDELMSLIKGKLAVLAGQSAVGKTSLVNKMFGLELKTGELSDKIARGKHTTTRSEIFEYGDYKIIDSPGFAVIDADVSIQELPECYLDYQEYSLECKYRGCTHISEPQCKVKEMVEKGELSSERYQRYVEIYNEISKRRIIYEKD